MRRYILLISGVQLLVIINSATNTKNVQENVRDYLIAKTKIDGSHNSIQIINMNCLFQSNKTYSITAVQSTANVCHQCMLPGRYSDFQPIGPHDQLDI